MNYRFERLSEVNFSDLEKLFCAVYGDDWDKMDVRNKFDTEPFGLKHIGFLAYHVETGEPAAYYGAFPLQVRLGGRTLMAVQSGDTMTHPSHRGKGLFVSLAGRTYDLCRELKIDFVFGYPNSNSYPGFIKYLKWKHLYDMVGWNRLIPTLPLAKISRRAGFGAKHTKIVLSLARLFFDVRKPSAGAQALAALQRDNSVIRDEKFARYKNDSGVLLIYRSAVVWVKVSDELSIGFADDKADGEDVRVALRILSLVCFLSGINRLKAYYSPGGRGSYIFGKTGIRRKSNPFGYLAFTEGIEIHAMETLYVDYDTF